jgi:hypothetical protein
MNRRFEIPIDPVAYNLFAIDDYLRNIRTSEDRKQLIRKVGYSANLREAYERKHGLPRGAVELAMMSEDRRVQEIGDKLSKRLAGRAGKEMSPQETKQLYLEVDSIMTGLRALYPDAVHFVKEYSALAQRNKTTFYGDYHFGNDYRIMVANVQRVAVTCPGPPPPDWCSPTPWFCTESYILTSYLAAWWIAGAVWYIAAVFVFALALLFFCVTPPAQIPC